MACLGRDGSGLNWRHSGSDSHDSLWERWQFHKRVRNRTHSIFILRFVVKRLHCMLCGVCRVSTVFLIACQLLNGAFSQIHFLPQFILKHFLYFQDEFLIGFNTVFYRLNSTNLCEYGLEMDVLKRIRQCCLSNFRDWLKWIVGCLMEKTAGFCTVLFAEVLNNFFFYRLLTFMLVWGTFFSVELRNFTSNM